MTQQRVVGFRPPKKLRREFIRKCKAMSKVDGYTSQNMVLNELITQFIRGSIKVPWEKK